MSGESENVAATLNPILYFTKLFGLTPFNSSKDNLCVFTLNLVWCSLHLFWNFYVLYKYMLYVIDEGIIFGIMDYSISCLIFINITASILKSCFAKNKILKVIADLSEIDNLIKISTFHNYKAFLKYKKRKICFLVVVTAALGFLLSLAYYINLDLAQRNYMFLVTSLCPGFVVMQFCAINLLIKDRFALLNHEISLMIQSSKAADNLQTIRHPINSDKIQKILILHERLCSIGKILNGIYSVSILCVITLQFIITINLLFYVILVMLYENVLPFVYIMNTIFCATSMFAVIIISSLTSIEAYKMRTLLDPIFISRNRLINLRIRNTLDYCLTNFYLQLIRNKLKFTACGLFILNNSLFYGIFAATVQYIIILMGIELGIKSGIITKLDQ